MNAFFAISGWCGVLFCISFFSLFNKFIFQFLFLLLLFCLNVQVCTYERIYLETLKTLCLYVHVYVEDMCSFFFSLLTLTFFHYFIFSLSDTHIHTLYLSLSLSLSLFKQFCMVRLFFFIFVLNNQSYIHKRIHM